MNKIIFFASTIMLTATLCAGQSSVGTVPRVYQYTASINTAVAKNAKKVTYTSGGQKYVEENVCYRTKGKVTFKGALIFGCGCMPYDSLEDGYPLFLITSSEDKFKTLYVYEGGVFSLMLFNRMGNPLSSKATIADMFFYTYMFTGAEEGCYRWWYLMHAGFGKTAIIDKSSGTMDLSTLSGNVTGYGMPPYCSAADNNCPRCLDDDDCEYAMAFIPCIFEDPFDYLGMDMTSAFGNFTLKFNKTYSNAIKDVPEEDIEGTVEALIPKAFKQIKSEAQVMWMEPS